MIRNALLSNNLTVLDVSRPQSDSLTQYTFLTPEFTEVFNCGISSAFVQEVDEPCWKLGILTWNSPASPKR